MPLSKFVVKCDSFNQTLFSVDVINIYRWAHLTLCSFKPCSSPDYPNLSIIIQIVGQVIVCYLIVSESNWKPSTYLP